MTPKNLSGPCFFGPCFDCDGWAMALAGDPVPVCNCDCHKPKEGKQDDVMIQKVEFPDEKGMLSIQARSPAFAALAAEYVRIFREDKGINYCEWTMKGPEDFGFFTVTFQKKTGVTPAEKAGKYRAALEKIRNARASGCSTGEAMSKTECWAREALEE